MAFSLLECCWELLFKVVKPTYINNPASTTKSTNAALTTGDGRGCVGGAKGCGEGVWGCAEGADYFVGGAETRWAAPMQTLQRRQSLR